MPGVPAQQTPAKGARALRERKRFSAPAADGDRTTLAIDALAASQRCSPPPPAPSPDGARRYHRILPSHLGVLRATLQKGDVLLVDGEQRVSQVIKYLTQSSWSHAALYVGDELWRRHPERRAELEARFGVDARHVLVEAIMEEGVVASPLAKYEDAQRPRLPPARAAGRALPARRRRGARPARLAATPSATCSRWRATSSRCR